MSWLVADVDNGRESSETGQSILRTGAVVIANR